MRLPLGLIITEFGGKVWHSGVASANYCAIMGVEKEKSAGKAA